MQVGGQGRSARARVASAQLRGAATPSSSVATWCTASQHGALRANMFHGVPTSCAALQRGARRCNVVHGGATCSRRCIGHSGATWCTNCPVIRRCVAVRCGIAGQTRACMHARASTQVRAVKADFEEYEHSHVRFTESVLSFPGFRGRPYSPTVARYLEMGVPVSIPHAASIAHRQPTTVGGGNRSAAARALRRLHATRTPV